MKEEANLQILHAGYSLHRKPFHTTQIDGHENYLIRLQTLGKCRSRLNGRLELLEPGDLLLFAPGDPYELKIEAEPNSTGEPAVSSGDYHIFYLGNGSKPGGTAGRFLID